MNPSQPINVAQRIREMRGRRIQLRKGEEVNDYRMLERKPGVVVYAEWGSQGWVGLKRGMVAQYVYLAGIDIRKESKLISVQRGDKFQKNQLREVRFTPYYLHLTGSPDYRYWTEDEAVLNLDGFARVRAKERELIASNASIRNQNAGGGGREPRWVRHWLERLGFRSMRDFEAVR